MRAESNPIGWNRHFTLGAKDSFDSAYEAIRELIDDALAVKNTWNAKSVQIKLHEIPERKLKDGTTAPRLQVLEITDDGIGLPPSAFESYFSEGGDHSEGTSLYGQYGRGALYALAYLSCHAIILSKSKRHSSSSAEATAADWSCGVWNPDIKPHEPWHSTQASANLIHYLTLFGLDKDVKSSDDLEDRFHSELEFTRALKTLNYLTWSRPHSCPQAPIKDLPDLISQFESMPETGVRILLTLDTNVHLESIDQDIVGDKGRSLRKDVPMWFIPRTHNKLQEYLPPEHIPPNQKIYVQGVAVDWSDHPWCTFAAKPGAVVSDVIKVKIGHDHEVLMQFMRPSEEMIAQSNRTDSVKDFPCGVISAYRPNRAIYQEDLEGGFIKPYLPREDSLSTYRSKVLSSGGQGKTRGYEELCALMGFRSEGEALGTLSKSSFSQIKETYVKACMGFNNVCALVLVELSPPGSLSHGSTASTMKMALDDHKRMFKSDGPQAKELYSLVFRELIKWVHKSFTPLPRIPRASAAGGGGGAAGPSSPSLLTPLTKGPSSRLNGLLSSQGSSSFALLCGFPYEKFSMVRPAKGKALDCSLLRKAADLVGAQVGILWPIANSSADAAFASPAMAAAADEADDEMPEWRVAVVEKFNQTTNLYSIKYVKNETKAIEEEGDDNVNIHHLEKSSAAKILKFSPSYQQYLDDKAKGGGGGGKRRTTTLAGGKRRRSSQDHEGKSRRDRFEEAMKAAEETYRVLKSVVTASDKSKKMIKHEAHGVAGPRSAAGGMDGVASVCKTALDKLKKLKGPCRMPGLERVFQSLIDEEEEEEDEEEGDEGGRDDGMDSEDFHST